MEYKPQTNEVTYQDDLYQAVKMYLSEWKGYQTQLEYRHDNCIFDIVVAKKGKVVLIIETKKLKNGSFPDYNTPQIKKYSRFGIPVVVCGHNKKITKVARAVGMFATCAQPDEKYHNPDIWSKLLAQAKFMATTREKKKRRKVLGIK